jgi:hypothetical protein
VFGQDQVAEPGGYITELPKAEQLAEQQAAVEALLQLGRLRACNRGEPACGVAVAIIQMLGIAGPSLIRGAAGTTYFKPGGVSFRD